MKTQNPKFLILLICLLTFSLNAVAQETIKFTVSKNIVIFPAKFTITVTEGKQFTIDWGDGSEPQIVTGTGQYQEMKYYYANDGDYFITITGTTTDCFFTAFSIPGDFDFLPTHLDVSKSTSLQYFACSYSKLNTLDLSNNAKLSTFYCFRSGLSTLVLNNNAPFETFSCTENPLNSLDLSNFTALDWLECHDNQLRNLLVSNNNKLRKFNCQNNKLHLSDLYNISSSIKPNDPYASYEIIFGEQRLIPQYITIGEQIDFSTEKEFLGISTVFTVEKDGLPALENDYTIVEGVITLNTKGKFKVSMTNSAITVQGPYYPIIIIPPIVIAEIVVNNVDIPEITKEKMRVNVYPNPTMGEFSVVSGGLKIENVDIFDISGKKQIAERRMEKGENEIVINISHLAVGVYFIMINTDEGIAIKKVIKN